jgi:ZIP family zinc transporter
MSKRSVVVLVAGVTLHNIAEGMATFIAALANKRLGIALGLAMVLHNIPEGFAISLPWYSATGKRWQGFLWAAAAGGAEVLAATAIYIVVISVGSVPVKQTIFACLFAVAGGMMTYIALHELYPHAVRMSPSPTYPTAGVFLGLAIMQLALGQLGIPVPDN